MRSIDRVVVAILFLACFAIMAIRLFSADLSLHSLIPQTGYDIMLRMALDGHSGPVQLRAALPPQTERQKVWGERFGSGAFDLRIEHPHGNRTGAWASHWALGHHELLYSVSVITEPRKYVWKDNAPIAQKYPPSIQKHLLPSEHVQSDHFEIQKLFKTLIPDQSKVNRSDLIRVLFNYTAKDIASAPFKGTTDALTCYRLGEASCGGKSRLFVSLLRAAGIPARLVGGLILRDGSWKESHVWGEAYIDGYWVPFCPLNERFAEIPASYLALYYGDYPLFTHTKDINFAYKFHAKQKLVPPVAISEDARQGVQLLNLWQLFERISIPVNLLKIILTIPLGVLAVVISRNIIGVQAFGTFMPALMAVAFRDTGLFWGILLFLLILCLSGLIRAALQRLQLLHTPRLAIVLTSTICLMILVVVAGVRSNHVLPTRIALFPIAILTLTVERFAVTIEESGFREALKMVLGTVIVASLAFAMMNHQGLEMLVVTFPEVLFVLVALFVILGRWRGMRLLEYYRFRHLLKTGERS